MLIPVTKEILSQYRSHEIAPNISDIILLVILIVCQQL